MHTQQTSARKRPVNLLLTEENVQEARQFTNNLSATVDRLLADFVNKEIETGQAKQRQYDAISEAWNQVYAANESFADEHSTL